MICLFLFTFNSLKCEHSARETLKCTKFEVACCFTDNSDYWIISTDYTTYSVVYGCRKQNSAGECVLPNVWVWRRSQPQLSGYTNAIVENTLDTLCVNTSLFLGTEQNNGINCFYVT